MKKNSRWSTKGKIRHRYFSWWGYLTIFLIFSIIGGIPGALYGQNWKILLHSGYVGWYLLYYALVSAIFSALIAFRRYHDFVRPLSQLSTAAKRVANGDFSVYLPPVHSFNNYDQLDSLFENFNQMVAELGSTETLKNNFIGNVSHEFKAPLAVIQSYAASLKRVSLSETEKERYLQIIIQATNDLAALVTNILRLSKLENQTIIINATNFDLSHQLADCILKFENRWEEKQLQVDVDLLDSCTIFADQELLAIVWNNLLTNAIKFTPSQGNIKISQQEEDLGVRITISDSGIGIDNETINHIFDQFYQGDSSHSKEGNGLGLAMVNKIIELSKGTVTVHSKLKDGTTLSVWLPLNVKK